MISKVLDGHSFGPACQYICNRKEAEILEAEGVREGNYVEMARDFLAQAQLREHKKQACFHAVLSFHPDDKVDRETMKEIARTYLEGIGLVNTQYVIALHTDKKHLHLHLIANMVNYNGRSISNAFIGWKGKQEAMRLTEAYQLIPAHGKDLSRTNLEALNESEANKYRIYQAITESLPACRNLEELEARLQKIGISTQYKYKSGTEQKQGISFKIGDDCIKGSKVDRKYSLSGLEKILAQNRELKTGRQQPAAAPIPAPGYEGHSTGGNAIPVPAVGTFDPEPHFSAGGILDTLFNAPPESEQIYIPRKRKKRRKL